MTRSGSFPLITRWLLLLIAFLATSSPAQADRPNILWMRGGTAEALAITYTADGTKIVTAGWGFDNCIKSGACRTGSCSERFRRREWTFLVESDSPRTANTQPLASTRASAPLPLRGPGRSRACG